MRATSPGSPPTPASSGTLPRASPPSSSSPSIATTGSPCRSAAKRRLTTIRSLWRISQRSKRLLTMPCCSLN